MSQRTKSAGIYKHTPVDHIDPVFDCSEPIFGAASGRIRLGKTSADCQPLATEGAYMKKSSWKKMWDTIEALEKMEKELHALAEGLR